jgi:predicted transcriptional regulator
MLYKLATDNNNPKVQRVIDLYKEGLSVRAIAQELSISKSSVHNYIKDLKLPSKEELKVQKHDELVKENKENQANLRASGVTDLQKYQAESLPTLLEGRRILARESNWNNNAFVNRYVTLDNQILKHYGFDSRGNTSSKIQIDVSVLKKGSSSQSPIIEAEITEEPQEEIPEEPEE